MKEKYYKRYVFRYKYRQWVNDILGGFKTWKEAKEYIDNVSNKQSCHCGCGCGQECGIQGH